MRLALRKPMGIVFEPMTDSHNPSQQCGVRICDLLQTGAAAMSQKLEVGDELLSINDKTTSRLTFDEIMDFIIEADKDRVYLLSRRPGKDRLGRGGAAPLQQHGDAHSPGGDGRKETYASHTESKTSPESETTADPPSRGEDHPPARPHNPMAEPSAYTDRGRCVRHPHIKLRKKKLMGGWKIMLVNCPDCCIEEMLRMRREAGGAAGGGRRGRAGWREGEPR